MDDPMKIIYKYKNNVKRTQYHLYVFIGDVPTNVMKILKKIQDKQLYEIWISLDTDELRTLVKFYGEYWYKKLFNTYHINFTIDTIRNKPKPIQDKFGNDWYVKHIKNFELMDRKLFYTYETTIRDEIMRKELKKKKIIGEAEDEDVDYRTTTKASVPEVIKQTSDIELTQTSTIEKEQTGGGSSTTMEILHTTHKYIENLHQRHLIGGNPNTLTENIEKATEEADTDEDNVIEFEEGIDDPLPEEELDAEDLDKIYQDMDAQVDDNIDKTTDLIKQALQDDKSFKKTMHGLIPFDTSHDNVNYDDILKNVYYKHYVTTQYIFKDDSIKVVKSKICCAIANNEKYGAEPYIIPSRQYLWSEYYFNNMIEKIMIGQKWIKRTDILQIDVEPNKNLIIFEELRGNLKLLRDNIRRFSSKIKREDDDFYIIHDYDDYYTNNEIYMIDVYNELGSGYNSNPEALRNVADVFIRVYFPRIKPDDVKHIVDYLNGNTKVEGENIATVYDTLVNDMLLENQITFDVEKVKRESKFTHLFKENYITQSVIHVNLRLQGNSKIDLFRIFNEFSVNDKYPFIQYQTPDGQIVFKYNEDNITKFGSSRENTEILIKWFETSPYGISFKVRILEKENEKFMAINLGDTGRMEYKTQWKEDDMATMEDIKTTYVHIKELLAQINKDKNKVTVAIPEDEEFKYAFINSIQKFELPEKFSINHNDLSEFSRYFYPYIALVIEPRKRLSKIKKEEEKSKYGSYLRYKRVSKYENQARIEQRVLYFIRNYDHTDQSLANEISTQFNITMERAYEEIERVRYKYPAVKKSRKILKKLDNIPKYKPPGIAIDIQGKSREQYKIRISGARNKEQLNRIITFMNILIYLYSETYLYKRPERQILKEKLKKLTNIAKRRNKVDNYVDYEKEIKTVKQITAMDKKRLGFRPDKGQNQWTRSCQNSGDNKKRQPKVLTQEEFMKLGFKLNKATGIYEKTVQYKKGAKKKQVTIKAVALDRINDDGTVTGNLYYTCNPEDNGEHMFIGFLSRSNNPYDQCMPCCFKKDPSISKNNSKSNYFMQCIGKGEKVDKPQSKFMGDKLYVLQDTNKIQDGRIGSLPKYMDFMFNQALNKTKKIKNHYLISSDTGYFFKYGSKQESQPFINAVAAALEINSADLRQKLIDRFDKDKSDIIFTALNNGDIRTSFITRDKFMSYITSNNNLNFGVLNHMMSIPGVLKPHGLNIILFEKETIIISKTLEKEKIRDDFTIVCQNSEEIDNLKDSERTTIILLKENRNYYPIVLVKKDTPTSKQLTVQRTFKYADKSDNIVNHLFDFYKRNCMETVVMEAVSEQTQSLTAKNVYNVLSSIKNDNFTPQYQIIDTRNKCKYIITKNSTIIPVIPSGTVYSLQILKNMEPKMQSYKATMDNIKQLYKEINHKFPIKPIGVYFNKKQKDTINVVGIMTELYQLIPVTPEQVSMNTISNQGLLVEYQQLFDRIDIELAKGLDNYQIDQRIMKINTSKFNLEHYQLFRYHFSDYINKIENEPIKKKLERYITDKKTTMDQKYNNIRAFLFRLINKNLLPIFEKSLKSQNNQTPTPKASSDAPISVEESDMQFGGRYDKLVHIISRVPDVTDYHIKNNRELCEKYDKDTCGQNKHCHWAYEKCYFAATNSMVIEFVNKISGELINNDHKNMEILQKGNYAVSDIVDYSRYKERKGQKIIKSTNNTINKAMSDIFGNDFMPKIGRRKIAKAIQSEYQEINDTNQMQTMGDYYTQSIIEDNLSLFRAYANGYVWLKHKHYDLNSRNLGYISELQTNIANYFRGKVVEWLYDKSNRDMIKEQLSNYMDTKKPNYIIHYINRMVNEQVITTDGLVEFFVLNQIHKIPVVVYDRYNTILFVIDGKIYEQDTVPEKYKTNLKSYINIRYVTMSMSKIPINIEISYYWNYCAVQY